MQFIIRIGEEHGLLALVRDAHGSGDDVHLIRGEGGENAVPGDILDLHVKTGFLSHGLDVVDGKADDFLVLVQHFIGREGRVGSHDKRFSSQRDRRAQKQGQQGYAHNTEHVSSKRVEGTGPHALRGGCILSQRKLMLSFFYGKCNPWARLSGKRLLFPFFIPPAFLRPKHDAYGNGRPQLRQRKASSPASGLPGMRFLSVRPRLAGLASRLPFL